MSDSKYSGKATVLGTRNEQMKIDELINTKIQYPLS